VIETFFFYHITRQSRSIPRNVKLPSGRKRSRIRQERARLTSKESRSLGSDRKESGQGDRESDDQEIKERNEKKSEQRDDSRTTEPRSPVTFARRDEVVPGLGDVGEGEMDHGSRVAAARQRCLSQAGHRAVRRVAVAAAAAASRFSLFSFASKRTLTRSLPRLAVTPRAIDCTTFGHCTTVASSVRNTTDRDRRSAPRTRRTVFTNHRRAIKFRDRKSVARARTASPPRPRLPFSRSPSHVPRYRSFCLSKRRDRYLCERTRA